VFHLKHVDCVHYNLAAISREPPATHPESINYEKLIKLFTDPHAVKVHERHIDVLQKLHRVYTYSEIVHIHLFHLKCLFAIPLNVVRNGHLRRGSLQ
jgi:hypothetical protein